MFLISIGCGAKMVPVELPPAEIFPPRIDTPLPTERFPLSVNPEALPPFSRAQFPASDGDRFFIALPPKNQDSVKGKEVLEEVIEPVLKAVGFTGDTSDLSRPPEEGVNLPVANLSVLAPAMAFQFDSRDLLRPKARSLVEVFSGKRVPEKDIDQVLQIAEGVDFAQFADDIHRQEIQYLFQQIHDSVPIEHCSILASRFAGQGISSVRGSLISHYATTNRPAFDAITANSYALKALGDVDGIDRVTPHLPEEGPFLLLLPYGSTPEGIIRLRYAYRMILRAITSGIEGTFLLWLDAESGRILKLVPLFNTVEAEGTAYNRDPGIGTMTAHFDVDPPSDGEYVLSLEGVANRVDYLGDGYNSLDLAIPATVNGSSSVFANFDQFPINEPGEALCSSGSNKAFQQVHFFATFYRQYTVALGQGMFTPFPAEAWSPQVEVPGLCNALSTMQFGACDGYYRAECPDYSTGNNDSLNYMNFAHDSTVIGHELGHNISYRLTVGRPGGWCETVVCPVPVGWSKFHDLADFWADHLESTNCLGGWTDKNMGGVDFSLYCLNHSEGGRGPRLHEVAVPFSPQAPGDHFPEHRSLATGEYADGQIAAAALWQVRLGVRSRSGYPGVLQFGVRFQRALRNTGFMPFVSQGEMGLYQMLYDMESEMVNQWAGFGVMSPFRPFPPVFRLRVNTVNKVTAGFARAGLFLVPYQCLDGDESNNDPSFCPRENGADSVIDIDDNDPGDDFRINGVYYPEVDFLDPGGELPTFHVWTGPRYRFDGTTGHSTFENPSPCNTKFRVELSNNPSFPENGTIISPWITVDIDPTTPDTPECYGIWRPRLEDLGGVITGPLTEGRKRIFYRARTRDASDGNERLSTRPGNGLWAAPPPYALITEDGRFDYW